VLRNAHASYHALRQAHLSLPTRPYRPPRPYYYWARLEGGELTSRLLSPAQAQVIRSAIANFREI